MSRHPARPGFEAGQPFVQDLGDERLFGKVVAVEGSGALQVERSDGRRLVWEKPPRGVTFVDEGSLSYRSATDPETFRAEFARDPLAVVVELLRQADVPMDSREIRHRLAWLGCVVEEDAWRSMQKGLRAHSHVRSVDRRYAWTEQPVDQERATAGPRRTWLELIETWSDPKTAKREHEALAGQIQKGLQTMGGGDETAAHVARALGLLPGSPDWAIISASSGLRANTVNRLLERAGSDLAVGFLVNAALDPGAKRVASRAVELLRSQDISTVGEALVDRVMDWRSDLETDGPQALSRIEPTARQFATALPDPVPARLRTELVRLLVVLARIESSTDSLSAVVEVTLNCAVKGASTKVIAQSINDASFTPAAALAVLRCLGPLPLFATSPRGRLLAAFAGSMHHSAVDDPGSWYGIDLAGLSSLLDDDNLGSPLTDRSLRETVLNVFDRALEAGGLGRLLTAIAANSKLAQLLPAETLADALRTTPKNDALASLLRAVTDLDVERERTAWRAKLTAAEASAGEQSGALESRIQELGTSLDAERARSAALEERLRSGARAGVAAYESQLRQARLDALRLVADLIEGVRNAQAAASEASPLLANLVDAANRKAEPLGLVSDGTPGDVVRFDPSRHRLLGEGNPTARVIVVSPSYGVRLDDSVTPLRYGDVAPVTIEEADDDGAGGRS